MNQTSITQQHTTSRSPAGDVEERCVNTIRMLAVDAVQKANSGHPGMPMGAATLGYVLWTRHLRHNPQNPSWPDRDRFVLSAGHGSMLLYSLLFVSGYDLTHRLLRDDEGWHAGDRQERTNHPHLSATRSELPPQRDGSLPAKRQLRGRRRG